jgi:hypothetical protein
MSPAPDNSFRLRLEENLARLATRQEAAAELAQAVAAAVCRAYDAETGSPELQGQLIDALQVIAELGGKGSYEDLDGLACIAAGH